MKRMHLRSVPTFLLMALVAGAGTAQATHGIPSRAVHFKGEVVQDFEPCTAPTTATSNPFLSVPACVPEVPSDPVCRFGTGGNGKVKISVMSGGDLRVRVRLRRLDAACIGETLKFYIRYAQTNHDCAGLGCTSVEQDLQVGSCTVSGSGSCTISTSVNAAAGGPVLASGLETSLEFRGCGLRRDGLDSFSCGWFVP